VQRRVEDDAEEIRQNALADAVGKRLAFLQVGLAMAFDAVAEDLVKEDAGGAAGENRRADERVGLRGVAQFLERGQGLLEGGAQHIVLGQARRILGVEALQGDQVLSIGALPRAMMLSMAKVRPCCRRVPSELTRVLTSRRQESVSEELIAAGASRLNRDSRRSLVFHSSAFTFRAGTANTAVRGGSTLKSAVARAGACLFFTADCTCWKRWTAMRCAASVRRQKSTRIVAASSSSGSDVALV